MEELDKGENIIFNNFESKEGERSLLSSNESDMRSPSLDFLDTSAENVTEDMMLEYLADIITDIYLKRQCLKNKEKKP